MTDGNEDHTSDDRRYGWVRSLVLGTQGYYGASGPYLQPASCKLGVRDARQVRSH